MGTRNTKEDTSTQSVSRPASIILEDGSVYTGVAFGAFQPAYGEVVFNTSMTGYQEILTDPSYSGQIVVPTYPLVGNYGINKEAFESRRVQVSGFIVRENCVTPSHRTSIASLDEFLTSQRVPGISGVDTRAITKRLRSRGVMMGAITVDESPADALERLRNAPGYGEVDFAAQVSTNHSYEWTEGIPHSGQSTTPYRILVGDYGLKYNILRILRTKGCHVTVVPASASFEDILARRPDGIIISPGPGDPALLDYAVETTARLMGRVPILGICLGNQILARALGGRTYKLKFGHRGANHPVRDLETGRVHITAQNHGYSVDADSLPADVEISHISLNDGTVEGLRHRTLPAMSIQYHSEGSPGPRDNEYVFDKFLELVRSGAKR